MKAIPRIAATAILASSLAAAAGAAPVNDLRGLGEYFRACMKGFAGESGEELTIAFSLRRDGSLLGKPKVTYVKRPAVPGARIHLLESVAEKFAACLPAPITPGLGGAIAGRPLTIHFIVPAREI